MTDFGKFDYERSRAERRTPVVRLRPKPDEVTIRFKIKRAIELLKTNSEVQIVVKMRGREMANREEAKAALESVLSMVVPAHGRLVSNPESKGSQISCTIASVANSDTDGDVEG